MTYIAVFADAKAIVEKQYGLGTYQLIFDKVEKYKKQIKENFDKLITSE